MTRRFRPLGAGAAVLFGLNVGQLTTHEYVLLEAIRWACNPGGHQLLPNKLRGGTQGRCQATGRLLYCIHRSWVGADPARWVTPAMPGVMESNAVGGSQMVRDEQSRA